MLHRFLYIIPLIFLNVACISDDNDSCYTSNNLILKVFDIENHDITTSGNVKNIKLYVYTPEGNFLDVIDVGEDQVKSEKAIKLPDYRQEFVQIVAWGNMQGTTERVKVLRDGSNTIDNYTIRMVNPEMHTTYPDYLFYGCNKVVTLKENGRNNITQEVALYPKMSSVIITTIGIDKISPSNLSAFSLELGESREGFDFAGNTIGKMIYYTPELKPAGYIKGQDISSTGIFNTMPSEPENPFTLKLYYNNKILRIVKKDDKGILLNAPVGKLLNITIRFVSESELYITVTITPWRTVEQVIEF